MYILENIKLKATAIVGISLSASLMLTSAVAGDKMANKAIDGGVKYEVKKGKYTSYYVNDQKVKYNHGRTPTKKELAAWNIDVMADGTGLPEFDMKHGEVVLEDGKPKKAQGTVEQGSELYDAQCVMCHGDFGSGGKGYPRLAGGTVSSLKNQLMNPADENPNPDAPIRTIGSYWPYASTLFWYVQDAMPFPHPKSLSNSETYALVAYLLSINNIKIDGEELGDDYVLDREKFLKIKMPNANGFYPDVDSKANPKQGPKNMQAFMADPKNYGKGSRCMKNCVKGKVPVLKIQNELKDFQPTPSTKRDWFVPENKAAHPMQGAYEEKCSACHGNAAIGAPVVGDKDAWAKVTAKGLDGVYNNGINGINGMPPKGGHEMSDDDFKKIVDYMIEASK